MNIGDKVHVQWRHMEEVQKYSCTDVWKYRCTEVQKNVAIEDGGSWFNKKRPRHVQL